MMSKGSSLASMRKILSKSARLIYKALPISAQRKSRAKNGLFRLFPFIFKWSHVYANWALVNETASQLSKSPHEKRKWIPPTEDGAKFVNLINAKPLTEVPVKLIAFYLPQFHEIPENNAWWGNGFTEWVNVRPAAPQFEGHYQPHIPAELGYYSLLDSSIQSRQVELAKLYGVAGFCFYTYWFGGKLLLEKPVENFLNDGRLDFPFCLCWANENWSRRWDGLDSEILISQDHSPEDDIRFIQYIAKYIKDGRYITINGKPLILVYRPALLPSAKDTAKRWRDWCLENGIGEIYLAYTQSFECEDPCVYGFDAAIEFPPNNSYPDCVTELVKPLNDSFGGVVYDWRVFVERSRRYAKPGYKLFRGVCPSWDNTARRKSKGTIFINSTPSGYQEWLGNAINDTCNRLIDLDERLVFINAWNEWAEGAHLEPDMKYGYAYLQATRNALTNAEHKSLRKIVYITHDCHPHGAQFLSLEVVRELIRCGFEVLIIALEGGDLEKEFSQLSRLFIAQNYRREEFISLLLEGRASGYRDVITSTVVCGKVLPDLKSCGFHVLSLVHELPGVIRSMGLENNAKNIAELADKIVFPAKLVHDEFIGIEPIDETKSLIRPQGLLRKNPYVGKNKEAYLKVCKRHKLPLDSKIILNIGYVDFRKGADLFVEIASLVCREYKNIFFIWVGHPEREMEKKVRDAIVELGLQKNVLFVGFNAEPFEYYAAASIFALTSREDPFPNVVLESASVGTPVVAFEGCTGSEDFIVEHMGALSKKLDVVDFAEKINVLLIRNSNALAVEAQSDFSLHRYISDLLYELKGRLRVSVVVPNYNYASLLRRRLDSIGAQNYSVYEIIILDDASSDDSVSLIRQYQHDSPDDIKLHENKVNSGSVFSQWAKGVSLATGDLIWIAEADDIADPLFLDALIAAFNDDEVVMAFSQSRQVDVNGAVLSNDYLEYTKEVSDCWEAEYTRAGIDEISLALAIKNTIPNVSGALFRRRALSNAFKTAGDGLFDFRVAGDWVVYMHVLKQGKIYFNPASLNHHCRHPTSVTSEMGSANHIKEVIYAQKMAQELVSVDSASLVKAESYLDHLYDYFKIDNDATPEFK